MDPFPPTEQQQRIIEHRGANLLVFAGPGTGKTETLARRFASLVAAGVAPSQILVLTFSRRAVDEMRDRILLRLRQLRKSRLAVSELFVKTFHSFCGRLLDGDAVRFHRHELLTPVKERLLWRQIVKAGAVTFTSVGAEVVDSPQFATDCLNVIGQLKGQGVTPGQLARLAGDDARLHDLAAVFAAMDAERERLGLRDYRDLVNDAVRVLQKPESTAAQWLRRADFKHILVDEFQDSDRMQLHLLEAVRGLMSPAPVFCFVGDVNQSIYRFRGATPSNVNAARDLFACQTLPLRDNRRSAQRILDVANWDETLDGQSKTTAADPDKRGSVRLVRPRNLEEEVRYVRDVVAQKVTVGTAPRAIAVLLRQTRPYQELIIDALHEAGIPVAALPTAGFHDDALIDAVLTGLRLLAAPSEQRLWRRLLANPIIGYRPIDVRFAFDAGHRQSIADPRTMLAVNEPTGVRPIKDFLAAWGRCAAAYQKSAPRELVETIVFQLDLLRPVRGQGPVPGFDLTASPLRLQALLDAAADYGEEGAIFQSPATDAAHGVREFIERLDETIGLLADANQPPPSVVEGVRVMSIHAAKGLEFDFVVVPQFVDGILPTDERPNRLLPARSVRALKSGEVTVFVDDDESRREEHSLWYVALTRAKYEVLATAAQVNDEGVDLLVSRFAKAIPAGSGDGRATLQSPATEVAQRAILRSPSYISLPIESLSPTSIGHFVECPRRFFYGDVLKLPRRDDDATRYGVALHRILRRFHEIEINFEAVGDPNAAAIRYAGALREIIHEETGLSGSAETGLGPLARFEREDLEQRLGAYARQLAHEAAAQPFSVVACEKMVTSPFGGIAVRGQVDRVDRRVRGGLIVRDYKSGRLHGSGLLSALQRAFARMDAGETIFGDAPDGLNLQTILYIPGVEEAYGEPVQRLDYIYFRGKGLEDSSLLVDSTLVGDSGAAAPGRLSRQDIARVEREFAAKIVSWCSSGTMEAFPTARDETTCRSCSFTHICPGAGAIAV